MRSNDNFVNQHFLKIETSPNMTKLYAPKMHRRFKSMTRNRNEELKENQNSDIEIVFKQVQTPKLTQKFNVKSL